ncbi:hypothetical protein [Sphaerotilus sp.]|jgi:hypothetical protein|uniref:hypothetical protein n=1 Tax=Sphaerotilus sp. TaxID=2093942 RepID=UPI0025EB9387|nr:hypothetical protein [Sphaerotilus sp.]
MLNIVVARRGEEVRWIDDLPEHCRVTVCTDDASHGVPLDVTRHIELVRLPGQHSVSELYLAYLKRLAHGSTEASAHPDPSAFTVFCPGDPLAVCPDFLALLEAPALWGDVQPLTQAQTTTHDPVDAQELTPDWRTTLPVAPVRFDLRSWAPLGGFDKTMYRAQQRYRQLHHLQDHQHPAAHFFAACQFPAFAQAIEAHDLGLRDSGLLFAVRQPQLHDWLAAHGSALPQVSAWLLQDPSHGRIWDQFWLHLFGAPLVRVEALSPPTMVFGDADTGDAGDEELEDFSLSRALATIDDTLARLAPPPLAQRSQQPSALQVARAVAAAQARRTTPSPQARQALQELSDRAAQAFRMGDLQYAVSCARLALQQDTSHTASRFTLAMALAAQGHRDEAVEQFEWMLQADVWVAGPTRVPDRTAAITRTQ